MVTNAEVAAALNEIADLLDLLGERFKPEAYRRAARSIESLPEGLEAFAGRDGLRSIPGVGEAIAEKVGELLRTGSLAYLDRLRSEVPSGVLDLMRLPGVGPKTARRFWKELGIAGPAELAGAIDAGRLVGVRGFAERKIGQLRAATRTVSPPAASGRLPLEEAWPLAQAIVGALRAVPTVHEAAIAGSFRRGRETVGDLDILVTADAPETVFEAFSRLPQVREVRLRGPTKETVVLDRGLQVDLRVVEPEAFGAALQYFTGSKDHNVRLRSLARDRGLKVNEYGVYRGDERVAGRTEEEVYAALGLAWIPPELREDRGEIDLAASGRLPRLLEAGDLTAELHGHLSERADGAEVDRWLSAARTRGLRSVVLVVGGWGTGGRQGEAAKSVRAAIATAKGTPRPIAAVEIDSAALGSLREALDALDAKVAIVVPTGAPPEPPPRAEPDPAVRLVAHAGGSPERTGIALAWARRLGAAMEVGPGSDRLDSTGARRARDSGVPLAVPTGAALGAEDATAPVALAFARRAGAAPDDVANCRDPGDRTTGRAPRRGPPRR
jgi:DNA polymerase (family X)